MFCDRDIEDDLGECDCCPGEACTQQGSEAPAEPLLRQHLATIVEALEVKAKHLRNAMRLFAEVHDEEMAEREYGARLASTQAALAWVQRLADTAAGFRVNDYGGSDPSFPQFDVGSPDNFAHGGHEGVRMGEQHAQIQALDTVETDALLRLAADLECRRRNEVAP